MQRFPPGAIRDSPSKNWIEERCGERETDADIRIEPDRACQSAIRGSPIGGRQGKRGGERIRPALCEGAMQCFLYAPGLESDRGPDQDEIDQVLHPAAPALAGVRARVDVHLLDDVLRDRHCRHGDRFDRRETE